MALITRCNIWTQLNTLNPFTDAAPCVLHRYDAGKNSTASTPLTDDQAQHTALFHQSAIASLAYTARGASSIVDFGASPSAPVAPVCSHVQGGRIPVAPAGWWWRENAAQAA